MIARKRVSLLACLMLAGLPQLPSSVLAADLDTAYAFDIPAQPLSSALVLFAKQSEIQVITASRDLDTYRIEAVQGQVSARDLLTKLLAGTGLTFVAVGDGTVTISKSSEQSVRRGADETTAEYRGILQEITVFGRGTTETVKDVPQTVSVFNADFIQNVQAAVADDIVRFTPNAVPYGWAVPLYTNVVVRGFASSLTWNGLAQRTTNGTLKLANVERVEVLKGPASVLYGSMEPGAVINLVTKHPQRQFEAGGNLQFGSNNERHYDLDIGGRTGVTACVATGRHASGAVAVSDGPMGRHAPATHRLRALRRPGLSGGIRRRSAQHVYGSTVLAARDRRARYAPATPCWSMVTLTGQRLWRMPGTCATI